MSLQRGIFQDSSSGLSEPSEQNLSIGNFLLSWLCGLGLVELSTWLEVMAAGISVWASFPVPAIRKWTVRKLANALWYPTPTLGFQIIQKLLLQNLVTHFIKVPGTVVLLYLLNEFGM